jgi:hypothetical protein
MFLLSCSRATAAAALPAVVAGCVTAYGPQSIQPGASLGEVTVALGPPTGRHARPDGERLEFARGPFGKHTYMLDFDAQGRMVRWQQVLTEPRFDEIRAGMSGDEVRMALGRPAETRPLAYQQRMLWSYRYDGPFCTWFQVGIDGQGRVVDTGYGPDPMCEDFNFGDSGK